jgi:hypothetical protein
VRSEREPLEQSVTVSGWYVGPSSWVKTRPVSVDAMAPAEPLGSSFAPGDQVRIVGAHPWSGHSGTITGPMPAGRTACDWIVDLPAVFMIVGTAEKNLRKITAGVS